MIELGRRLASRVNIRPVVAFFRRCARLCSAHLGRFGIGKGAPWFRLPPDEFVRETYRVLLGREPEPDAVEMLSAQVRMGRSRQSILGEIRRSAEGSGRPVADPALRGILETKAARTPPDELALKIIGLEKNQRALVQAMASDATADRLARLEAKLDALHTPGSRSSGPSSPRTISGTRIGPHHVLIIATGAALEPQTNEWLARAALEKDSDIIFGDEFVRSEQARTLRIYGPYAENVFLAEPCLGGVLAVRETLLRQLGLPCTIILTGSVLLQLVAKAFTLAYVPAALCERRVDDLLADRPSEVDTLAHWRELGRAPPISSEEPQDGTWKVNGRNRGGQRWKAALIVTSTGAPEVESSGFRPSANCRPRASIV